MLNFKTCSFFIYFRCPLCNKKLWKKIKKKWRESASLFLVLVQPILVVARPLHAFTPFTNVSARVTTKQRLKKVKPGVNKYAVIPAPSSVMPMKKLWYSQFRNRKRICSIKCNRSIIQIPFNFCFSFTFRNR